MTHTSTLSYLQSYPSTIYAESTNGALNKLRVLSESHKHPVQIRSLGCNSTHSHIDQKFKIIDSTILRAHRISNRIVIIIVITRILNLKASNYLEYQFEKR